MASEVPSSWNCKALKKKKKEFTHYLAVASPKRGKEGAEERKQFRGNS